MTLTEQEGRPLVVTGGVGATLEVVAKGARSLKDTTGGAATVLTVCWLGKICI